jgi:hypothetical protein
MLLLPKGIFGAYFRRVQKKRKDLIQSVHDLMVKALGQKRKHTSLSIHWLKSPFKVGWELAEHDFLMDHYQVDSVGWGSFSSRSDFR